MTAHEADKLLRTLWIGAAEPNHTVAFRQVARAVQMLCPDIEVEVDLEKRSLTVTNVSAKNAQAAHEAALLAIQRKVELTKKRLDAELEIQKCCAFIEERERKKTVPAKGRWEVRFRRSRRGGKWVRYRVRRKVTKTVRVDVHCNARRLGPGFGDLSWVCEKHARKIRAQALTDARSSRSKAAAALAGAKIRVRTAAEQQAALEAKLARRRKS